MRWDALASALAEASPHCTLPSPRYVSGWPKRPSNLLTPPVGWRSATQDQDERGSAVLATKGE